jgi:predicted dehydrogenase
MSKKFGVIGSAHGHIFEFIEDMLKIGGEFVGIYDDNSQLCKEISQKYNIPIFKDKDELIESGVEVVGTSAISNEKIDIIEYCESKGVHIIADKPIVTNKQQLNRLEKIIERGIIQIGLLLTVRFMPEVYAVKQLINSGKLGRLLSIEIFNPHKLSANSRPDWHFEHDKGGGVIIDLMVHSVDLYRWLSNNEIDNYSGLVKKSMLPEKPSFYDMANFSVQSGNGISGYLRVDWHMTTAHWSWGDLRIFCTGTKGSIEIRALGDPITKEPIAVFFSEDNKTTKLDITSISLNATSDFINRIDGKAYIISHKDIVEGTRVCLDFDFDAKKIDLLSPNF